MMAIRLTNRNSLYRCKSCNHAIVASRKPRRCSECCGAMAKVGGGRNKFNAEKTTVDGIEFDSKREAARYCELKRLRQAGEIDTLLLQPEYELQPAFVDNTGKKQRAIVYRADFSYFEDGRLVVEDVKGYDKNPVWRLKQKMFLYHYPKIELRITK